MTRPTGPPPRRALLVEGPNDKHVVRHIRLRHAGAPSFCILEKDGVDNLLAAVDREFRVPGRQSLGILIDANDDVAARWAALQDRLARVKVDLPGSPDPTGTIIESRPRVGVWLMPDNTAPGELEDFVIQMIPARDAVWPLSQDYIDGIPCAERKFSGKKQPRAQLYAWLAAREDPRRMGEAIRTRDLAVDGPLCQTFVAWLRKLFG